MNIQGMAQVQHCMLDLLQLLKPNERKALLISLLAQEICSHPQADRQATLNRITTIDLHQAFKASEQAMREVQVENAKRG